MNHTSHKAAPLGIPVPLDPCDNTHLDLSREAVLLAVTGKSPAVLTETVWALSRENPPVIPHRVVVVTTISGRQAVERELLLPGATGEPTIWESLRNAILGPNAAADPRLILEPPRLLTAPNLRTGVSDWLEDIRTPAENEAAADFLLEEVRRQVERPNTHLVASLAGGRKTMSALLYAAMTLLARETDRLTHILVDEPFEDARLNPRFYFPEQSAQALKTVDGRIVVARSAQIELADVPYVPLRNRFADLAEIPTSFSGLIGRFTRQLKIDAGRQASVTIDHGKRVLTVETVGVPLRAKALTLLHYLLDRQTQNATPEGHLESIDDFEAWRATQKQLAWSQPLGLDDLKHELSHLRGELRRRGIAWTLPPRSLYFPPFALRVQVGPVS